ncbi:MAG TPA: hypothetical protein VJT83_07735 [Chitinophagaceae bacterium]|nr:hypothetical protein [Chitinophagaceae bacterium]
MKKVFLFALIAVAFSSCKKSTAVFDPSTPEPKLVAKLYPTVNQPVDATLGQATFTVGDKVVVYVPYQITADDISFATLLIKDDLGEVIDTKQLFISYDPDAEGINIPDELKGTTFMVGTIEIGENYLDKNFSITIEMRGSATFSTDVIENAFVVLP